MAEAFLLVRCNRAPTLTLPPPPPLPPPDSLLFVAVGARPFGEIQPRVTRDARTGELLVRNSPVRMACHWCAPRVAGRATPRPEKATTHCFYSSTIHLDGTRTRRTVFPSCQRHVDLVRRPGNNVGTIFQLGRTAVHGSFVITEPILLGADFIFYNEFSVGIHVSDLNGYEFEGHSVGSIQVVSFK